jgi:hypothetical protein
MTVPQRVLALLGLLAVVGVVVFLLPSRAEAPGCDPAEVFAVNPVNREIAGSAVVLSAYGRSEAALAPGDTLCLKLDWAIGVEQPALNGLRIELRDSRGTLSAEEKPLTLSPPTTTSTHTLRVPPRAAGGLTVTIIPLNDGGAIGAPLDLTTITANP